MRAAAVDLGTNSTRLLVADVEDGCIAEVARRLRITRLGEDVDAGGTIVPAALARVRGCLAEYRRDLDALKPERVLAIATSALRDAGNGADVLAGLGLDFALETRLLTGDEEALMTFSGVTAGRSIDHDTLIVDIGGGSTELILGGPGGVSFHRSLNIGCVRMTERFGDDLDACAAHVRGALPQLQPATAVGVAGTVTSLAALDLGLVAYDPERIHGHRLTRAAVDEHLRRLAALPLDERRRVPGLEPDRAPVIVAGAVILREVLDTYHLHALEASEHDILHGAVLAAAYT